MTISGYLIELSTYLVLIPLAVMCLIPMKNQFKKSLRFILISTGALLLVGIPFTALLSYCFDLSTNLVLFPALFVFYFLYHKSLKVPHCKSAAFFIYIAAYMSIISDVAHGFTALIYEDHSGEQLQLYFSILQFGLAVIFMVVTFHVLLKFGPMLVDSLALNRVWYATLPVSVVVIVICLRVAPQKYETLYVNNIFKVFWVLLGGLMIFMMFFSVVFYFMVTDMERYIHLDNRNRMLEVQENLFIRTQNYLDETSRIRHDFKQTIYTLKSLADNRDLDTINEYLDAYIEALPAKGITVFCKNHPLNALLNYYSSLAHQEDTDFKVSVDLTEDTTVSDVDLCSIVGNLVDNAITAGEKLDANERHIKLIISQNHNSHLYIIQENRFNGITKTINGQYLSTKKMGSGIGLSSIAFIAERYGGTARFHNDDKLFYSEVML